MTTSPAPTFTCNACGTQGALRWMSTHPCETIATVRDSGGRCEDYPCCGHTDGDGCAPLESHTADYWRSSPHLLCDHENGYCDDADDDDANDDADERGF